MSIEWLSVNYFYKGILQFNVFIGCILSFLFKDPLPNFSGIRPNAHIKNINSDRNPLVNHIFFLY